MIDENFYKSIDGEKSEPFRGVVLLPMRWTSRVYKETFDLE